MIRSMTGFGRAQAVIDSREILVEIRSVNHRYYEFSARIPRAYGYLEEKLKSLLQGKIARGKVEVSVSVVNIDGKDALIELNEPIARGYIDALTKANENLGLKNDLALTSLLRLPDVFTVRKPLDDEEAIWSAVKQVASEAADRFVAMREAEGERLKADILEKLSSVRSMVAFIEARSPEVTEKYRARLLAKLSEVLDSKNIDEQRILLEAAIFAEKVAVDEETVRLKSHLDQFESLLGSGSTVGRKLDFLVQEMNREANTTGSKSQDIDITRTVVDIKSEIEKIREQIQNIE